MIFFKGIPLRIVLGLTEARRDESDVYAGVLELLPPNVRAAQVPG